MAGTTSRFKIVTDRELWLDWRERLIGVYFVRNALFVLGSTTLFLMAVGSMTRVMEAGLACPDWPLCYGSVLPKQMDGLVFWEWFHRVIATTVGAITLGLTLLTWWSRKNLPRWLPWGVTAALGVVMVQGVLGALTVTQQLRFDIVTSHLGTATFYLGLVLSLGFCLQPVASRTQLVPVYLPWVAVGAALISYLQIILGGLVASQWALSQCLGKATLCQVMHNHLWGVAPTLLALSILVITVWRSEDKDSPVTYAVMAALVIVCLQVGLGLATYILQLRLPLLTIAHLVMGVSLFASLVVTATLAFRAQHRPTISS